MATILAGILASKISFHLQSRVFSIPWVKRSTAIFCLKSRDHSSSSVPVRYIPKKYSIVHDNEVEKSLPTIAKSSEKRVFDKSSNVFARNFLLDEEARNQKKMYKDSVLFDDSQGKFRTSESSSRSEKEINNNVEVIHSKLMAEPKEDTEETGILPERDILKNNGQAGKTMIDAEKMAIEFLSTRAFTTVELRKKLLGKRFSLQIVEALLTDFQRRGLINDSFYAEAFSRSRWSSSTWGPRRIKQVLFKKGVSEVDAEKAIKLVFEDGESGGQESKLGMSKISLDHLLVQSSKHWNRGQDIPKETRKSRIIRWLQYRGFNWEVISYILKKLESQCSS